MQRSFNDAMDWVHTWSGVILGAIMFVIFFMGTLSVFADETDQWFWPQVRHADAHAEVSLDRLYETAVEISSGQEQSFVGIVLPNERMPVAQVRALNENGKPWIYFVDPKTYDVLAPMDSASASHFFYPMHYKLHVPGGIWIVGATSMFLLLGLFSGIIIHHKIFVDFFTFRRGKKMPRVSLDLHNLTSVLAMPFHLAITITGILIFSSIYLERSAGVLFPDAENARAKLFQETYGTYSRELSGETNLRIASLDAMAIRAQNHWGGASVSAVIVRDGQDENGTVQFGTLGKDRVTHSVYPVIFDADSGKLLDAPEMTVAAKTQAFIVGMHEIHFDHLLLRWLYVVGGLAGCVMISTGFIYWIESRRVKHARGEKNGVPWVEGLTIWAVMGLLTATASYFVINQVLARGTWEFWGIQRIYWEVIVFYIVWLLAIPHGAIRKRKAWFDQSVLLAGLCVTAVVLNWVNTGDHLAHTIAVGQWPVAVMDAILLITAGTAVYAARRLSVNWKKEAEDKAALAAKRARHASTPVPANLVKEPIAQPAPMAGE